MIVGDEVLVERNNEFTPKKVLDVFHSTMQGDHKFCLFFCMLFVVYIKVHSGFEINDSSHKFYDLETQISTV